MRTDRLKSIRRLRRKRVIRTVVKGIPQRPRLTVFRSLKNIYAQLIDDVAGVTLCEASSRDKDLRGRVSDGGNVEGAKVIGAVLAERAKGKGVENVCFDRNGYRYHGRIKALAEAAREGGLKF